MCCGVSQVFILAVHKVVSLVRKPTRRHVDGEELPEVRARVVLGKQGLDGVLEGKVEGLRGEVAQHICQVAAPEGQEALALCHAHEAIDDTCTDTHAVKGEREGEDTSTQ